MRNSNGRVSIQHWFIRVIEGGYTAKIRRRITHVRDRVSGARLFLVLSYWLARPLLSTCTVEIRQYNNSTSGVWNNLLHIFKSEINESKSWKCSSLSSVVAEDLSALLILMWPLVSGARHLWVQWKSPQSLHSTAFQCALVPKRLSSFAPFVPWRWPMPPMKNTKSEPRLRRLRNQELQTRCAALVATNRWSQTVNAVPLAQPIQQQQTMIQHLWRRKSTRISPEM